MLSSKGFSRLPATPGRSSRSLTTGTPIRRNPAVLPTSPGLTPPTEFRLQVSYVEKRARSEYRDGAKQAFQQEALPEVNYQNTLPMTLETFSKERPTTKFLTYLIYNHEMESEMVLLGTCIAKIKPNWTIIRGHDGQHVDYAPLHYVFNLDWAKPDLLQCAVLFKQELVYPIGSEEGRQHGAKVGAAFLVWCKQNFQEQWPNMKLAPASVENEYYKSQLLDFFKALLAEGIDIHWFVHEHKELFDEKVLQFEMCLGMEKAYTEQPIISYDADTLFGFRQTYDELTNAIMEFWESKNRNENNHSAALPKIPEEVCNQSQESPSVVSALLQSNQDLRESNQGLREAAVRNDKKLEAVVEANNKKFEALVEANKAATEANKAAVEANKEAAVRDNKKFEALVEANKAAVEANKEAAVRDNKKFEALVEANKAAVEANKEAAVRDNKKFEALVEANKAAVEANKEAAVRDNKKFEVLVRQTNILSNSNNALVETIKDVRDTNKTLVDTNTKLLAASGETKLGQKRPPSSPAQAVSFSNSFQAGSSTTTTVVPPSPAAAGVISASPSASAMPSTCTVPRSSNKRARYF